jgi:hypothetical protein
MVYLYEKLLPPDLTILESNFLVTSLAETYQYFRWDEEDKKLKIYLNRELNISEKEILDNLVSLI